MNQERKSGSDAEGGTATGLMEPQTANAAQVSSPEARVDNLVALVLSFPDLRSARVQELKAQIDAGTYHVPAEQIAAALCAHMRLWLD
jgi:flagellar biosynthesis anti-sigma factor FlgM